MFISPRRRVLKAVIATVAGNTVLSRLLPAAENVSPQDPIARNFLYTEDAATVDSSKAPTFKPGSDCGNCALYLKAQAQNDHAPCAIFGNKLVPAKGWCAVWVRRLDGAESRVELSDP